MKLRCSTSHKLVMNLDQRPFYEGLRTVDSKLHPGRKQLSTIRDLSQVQTVTFRSSLDGAVLSHG